MPIRQLLHKYDFNDKLDELYEQARLARPELGKFIRKVCETAPGEISFPDLKNRDTAEGKLRRESPPSDPESLRDICRATITYESLPKLFAARSYIQEQPEYTRLARQGALKDRFEGNPTPSGYRDINFNLAFHITNVPQSSVNLVRSQFIHICELQLQIKQLSLAKKIEHPVYEIIRRYDSTEPEQPVVIPAREVKKLGCAMRGVWIVCKRKEILTSADDLRRLREIVELFFEPKKDLRNGRTENDCSTLQRTDVTVRQEHILFLEQVTLKLYQTYTSSLLQSRIWTADGSRPALSFEEYDRLRKRE